jgi:acyl carrier protein
MKINREDTRMGAKKKWEENGTGRKHRNGNSLITVQLIGRLNEEYQVEIPMSHFYEEPTIAHLAAVINELLSKLK